MNIASNREAWLSAALTRISKGWPTAAELPEGTRISVGFPVKTRGRGAGRVTEHYRATESDGGMVEIFVSPTLADAAQVCRAVALEAAAVALNRTPAESERAALFARADTVAASLPAYPHDALAVGRARAGASRVTASDIGATDEPAAPGPGSRMLKVCCPSCGYTVRTSRRWLAVAVPLCPAPGCDRRGVPMAADL